MNGAAPVATPPHITRIRDVPNDQGGKVFITWTKAALDVTGGAVNGYTVWRLVTPAGRRARGAHTGARRTVHGSRARAARAARAAERRRRHRLLGGAGDAAGPAAAG